MRVNFEGNYNCSLQFYRVSIDRQSTIEWTNAELSRVNEKDRGTGHDIDQSSAFQQRHSSEPAIGADAHNGPGAFRPGRKLLHGLTENSCPGRGKRMAKRYGTARRVHPVSWKPSEIVVNFHPIPQEVFIFPGLHMKGELSGKSFVDFPKIDIRVSQAMTREKPRHRESRRHQKAFDFEVDGSDLIVNQPCPRRTRGKFSYPRL
jgi:hypothetical protein